VFVIAVLVGTASADPDQGVATAIGFAGGGGWTPGGLHLDAAYMLRLDHRDWFDIGLGFTLGDSAAACYDDQSGGYTCSHGIADGEAASFSAGVRHYLSDSEQVQPFLRGGIGVSVVRFPDEIVGTATGIDAVTVQFHAGIGARRPITPSLALVIAGDVYAGAGAFSGTADAQRQIGFTTTIGAELQSAPGPDAGFVASDRVGNPLSFLGVAAVYAPFITWEYYAWYHGAHHVPVAFDTSWNDEKLGLHTYAGGADKFGHMYIHYVLTRGTTNILTDGGWDRWAASLICFSVDQLEATFSEMKDGPVWGYELGDSVGNFSGAALAVLMENVPALDRLFDFRLEYWPSPAYIKLLKQHPFSRGDGLDISQDYTGQSYMLALHVGALPYDHETPTLLWTKYADVVFGFESRHYEPAEMPIQIHRQTQYIGLAVNMQAVLESLFRPSRGRTVAHGIAEVYSVPLTTLHLADYNRYWDPTANTMPH
jgi:hypothetical protein